MHEGLPTFGFVEVKWNCLTEAAKLAEAEKLKAKYNVPLRDIAVVHMRLPDVELKGSYLLPSARVVARVRWGADCVDGTACYTDAEGRFEEQSGRCCCMRATSTTAPADSGTGQPLPPRFAFGTIVFRPLRETLQTLIEVWNEESSPPTFLGSTVVDIGVRESCGEVWRAGVYHSLDPRFESADSFHADVAALNRHRCDTFGRLLVEYFTEHDASQAPNIMHLKHAFASVPDAGVRIRLSDCIPAGCSDDDAKRPNPCLLSTSGVTGRLFLLAECVGTSTEVLDLTTISSSAKQYCGQLSLQRRSDDKAHSSDVTVQVEFEWLRLAPEFAARVYEGLALSPSVWHVLVRVSDKASLVGHDIAAEVASEFCSVKTRLSVDPQEPHSACGVAFCSTSQSVHKLRVTVCERVGPAATVCTLVAGGPCTIDALDAHGEFALAPTKASHISSAMVGTAKWGIGNLGRSIDEEKRVREEEGREKRRTAVDTGEPPFLYIPFVVRSTGPKEDEPARGYGAAFVDSSTGLRRPCLIGGCTELGSMAASARSGTYLYDNKAMKWSVVSCANDDDAVGRVGHTAVGTPSGSVLVFGGLCHVSANGGINALDICEDGVDLRAMLRRRKEHNSTEYASGVWEGSVQSGKAQWECITTEGEARVWHAAAMHGTSMYVVGGICLEVEEVSVAVSSCEVPSKGYTNRRYAPCESIAKHVVAFSTVSREWRTLPMRDRGGVAAARAGHTMVAHNGVGYVFGGVTADRCLHNDIHAFSFASEVWHEVLPMGQVRPPPVFGHAAAIGNVCGATAMFVVGGVAAEQSRLRAYMFIFDTQFWRAIETTQRTWGGPRFRPAIAVLPRNGTQSRTKSPKTPVVQLCVAGGLEVPCERDAAGTVQHANLDLIFGTSSTNVGVCGSVCIANLCLKQDADEVELSRGAQLLLQKRIHSNSDAPLLHLQRKRSPAHIEKAMTQLSRPRQVSPPHPPRAEVSTVQLSQEEILLNAERLSQRVTRYTTTARQHGEESKKLSPEEMQAHIDRVYAEAAARYQQARDYELQMAARLGVPEADRKLTTEEQKAISSRLTSQRSEGTSRAALRRERARPATAKPLRLRGQDIQDQVGRLYRAPPSPLSSQRH